MADRSPRPCGRRSYPGRGGARPYRPPQEAFRLSNQALAKAKERLELEKLSFSYSGPLGRAATLLHERFHLTGAGHREDFFKKKPKPQTGYEKNQNAFRRVDNAEALAYLVCCLAAEIIDDRG